MYRSVVTFSDKSWTIKYCTSLKKSERWAEAMRMKYSDPGATAHHEPTTNSLISVEHKRK